MPAKKEPAKIRTDLTGRHNVTSEEIIKGLTPPTNLQILSPVRDTTMSVNKPAKKTK